METPRDTHLFSIQDFLFVNSKETHINIRVHSPLDPSENLAFLAAPLGNLNILANYEFHVTGSTQEEALKKCIKLVNELEDLSSIFSPEEKDADSKPVVA